MRLLIIVPLLIILISNTVSSSLVIIETVNDYSNRSNLSNLSYANEFGRRIENIFSSNNINVIHWKDDLAWESDFEYLPTWPPLIRYADMTIFSGHGSPACFHFNNNKDKDNHITYMVDAVETYWYDDTKWVVMHACYVLRNYSWVKRDWVKYAFGTRWGVEYIELHGIYGFENEGYDYWSFAGIIGDNQGNTGQTFAEKIIGNWSIKDAWFEAIRQHEQPPWWTGLDPAHGAVLAPYIVIYYRSGGYDYYKFVDEGFIGHGPVNPDPNELYNRYANDPNAYYFSLTWDYIVQP